MPVATSVLTFDANSSTTSTYTTASIAPAADRMLLAAVSSTRSDGAEINSITGLGLTWTRVDGDQVGSSPVRRVSFWRAVTGGTAPTPGPLTLNYGSTTPASVLWAVLEVTDADTAAVVQSKVATVNPGTTLTTTFNTAPAAGNGIVTCTAVGAQDAVSPGTGMTVLTGDTIGGPNGGLQTQWRNSGATSASSSWASSVPAIMVALEIKAAGDGSGPVTHDAGGTTAVTSATTGTTRLTASAGGTVGTVAATTAAVALIAAAAGTVPAVSDTTGEATAALSASGTTAATSGTSGTVEVVAPGPVTHDAGGTVAVVSGGSGQAAALLRAIGSTQVVSGSSGQAALVAGPVTHDAGGTVAVVSGASGAATTHLAAGGTVVVVSGATGSVMPAGDLRNIDATATLAPRRTSATLAARRTTATLGSRRASATLEEQ